MLIEIDEDIADIEARYERFQQIAETACAIKLQFIEWRDFRLAAALIRSRWVIVTDSKFEENAPKWLQIGSRDDSAGLAPYFDMLNHANEEDYNCNYFYKDDTGSGIMIYKLSCLFDVVPCIPAKGLQVVAANDLKAGDQLLINYGHRSDDELLLNYGFVLGSGFAHF